MSKTMANPKGAKAGEPYQNFDEGGFHRNQLSPLPKIGEGFREWSEAPSYEEGVGDDGGAEGLPSDGVWGYPPARDVSRCVPLPMVSPSVRLSLTVCGRAKLRCMNAGESCKGWRGMAKPRSAISLR